MSACERVEVCLPAGRLSVFAEPPSLSCRPACRFRRPACRFPRLPPPETAASRVMCVWPPLIPVPFRLYCATDQALARPLTKPARVSNRLWNSGMWGIMCGGVHDRALGLRAASLSIL